MNFNDNNSPYNKRDYYINEMKQKREKTVIDTKTTSGKIQGFLLLWCVVSVILAMILASNEVSKSLTIVLLGQAFAIFGIMPFSQQKHKLEGFGFLIIAIAGIVMFIVGLLMLIGGEAVGDKLSELAPYGLVSVFYIVGLSMLIMPPIINKKKKERCTVPVQAVVIDHIRNHGGRHRTYAPLFEYEYRGVKYRERDNISIGNRSDLPMIGKKLPMYINEEEPTDFYVEWEGKRSSMIVGAICIMLIPTVLVIVLVLQNVIN